VIYADLIRLKNDSLEEIGASYSRRSMRSDRCAVSGCDCWAETGSRLGWDKMKEDIKPGLNLQVKVSS
jgi:hypothetical protein